MRRLLGGWRDLVILNDEAHHVYGEKRVRRGEEPEYIKWSKIIERIRQAARISLVVDLSATPWYGSGSPKPEGTLFEWLVSDFSVYDAFESGLVKVVRLPDPDSEGRQYLDLWDQVKGARTKEEYLSACKGAIASIYASWGDDYREWESMLPALRPGPSPVLLVVADKAERAEWLFEHLSQGLYDLLRNPDDDNPLKWLTIRIDTKIFDAEKGKEATLREMVNTVGKKGKAGEHVRCIVSVQMLTEGWDVKSVTHILGLRAFGSPLLTEQIVGRGLRRTTYDGLLTPIEERLANENRPDEETVDAFGIPFVGFPIEKRKRPRAGTWGQKPVPIEPDLKKEKYAIRVPNVRSWAVGVATPLREAINMGSLPGLVIDSKETPSEVRVRPVVGGEPEAVMTLERFRAEYPLLRSKFIFARELFEATNPGAASDLGIGPTFEELLEFASEYVDKKVTTKGTADPRDIGIYYWSRRALNILETAIREAPIGTAAVPILSKPEYLDTRNYRRKTWTGITAVGKKCHLSKVPCHTNLEASFANFLDGANDVLRYMKNEFFGFSITYYENNRPRQYFPDFVVSVRESDGREVMWLAETKGEIRPNTALKREAAELWCQKMSATTYGTWRYLFAPQRKFERALASGIKTFAELAKALVAAPPERQLHLIALGDERVKREAFKTLLPVYSLKAAAGYFGDGQAVEPEGWVEVDGIGRLDDRMFVAQVVGRSMEPQIYNGDYCVFRANPVGSRQGKIVLVQYRGPEDPETGGSFTVKRYSSKKITGPDGKWKHSEIRLEPLNRDFEPLVLAPESENDVRVIAELVSKLG
jgi:type III restriction enzyme